MRFLCKVSRTDRACATSRTSDPFGARLDFARVPSTFPSTWPEPRSRVDKRIANFDGKPFFCFEITGVVAERESDNLS